MLIEDRFAFWNEWLLPCGPASFASFGFRLREGALEVRMRPFAARRRAIPIAAFACAFLVIALVAGFRHPFVEAGALATAVAGWLVARLFPGLSRAIVVDGRALRVQDAVPSPWFVLCTFGAHEIVGIVAEGGDVVVERRNDRVPLPLGALSPDEARLLAELLARHLTIANRYRD